MMFLDLAIALSCAGVGLVCGWIMHAIGWGVDPADLNDDRSMIDRSELDHVKGEYERLAAAADRLREYAITMAMDVDLHQSSVQAVSDALSSETSFSADELGEVVNRLIDANQTMQSKLQTAQSRISEQADQLESAERRAQTDALTRVSNRGAFDEHLARRHALGPGRAGTLMLLDVDHFKKFNDEHGHRAGDEVLKVVANMLHARLKSYGIVARFGGEEFAAIIDGYTVEESKQIVESARAAIGQHLVEFEGKQLAVTASIGLAEPLEAESIEQWIERADSAMYHSKNQGRNCGHWMDVNTPELITLGDEPSSIPDIDEALPTVAIPPANQTAAPKPQPRVPAARPNHGAFSSLPDRAALTGSFAELQERSKSIGLPTQVMQLHVSGAPAAGSMRTLLQIVRATMRSVDRIGAEDDSTLLVCMPGINDDTAQEKVKQIRSSAESLQFGEPSTHESSKLDISVIAVEPDETLDEAIARTPAPVSPAPVSPAPVSPAPVSPAPVSPAPVSPAPANRDNATSPESDLKQTTESAVPESAVPESAVPESAVPESAVPESAVPASNVPDQATSAAKTKSPAIAAAPNSAAPPPSGLPLKAEPSSPPQVVASGS
ncbi:GGDEF domain-containing protein [Novipirellula galeiformis]|nr:GGDEF domain-containing protein [Novipirellula galeiformis]